MRIYFSRPTIESFFLFLILFFCVFGGAFSIDKSNIVPIDLYIYYLIIPPVIGIILLRYPTINIYFIVIPICFFIIGMFHIMSGNNSPGSFAKNFIGICIVYFFYFLVCKYFPTVTIIKYYLYLCILSSYIALFQYSSYLIGFKTGYHFSWIFPRIPASISITNNFRAYSIFLNHLILYLYLLLRFLFH